MCWNIIYPGRLQTRQRINWVDGVLLPEDSQLSKSNIIDNRRIITQAWIGWQGTTKQELFDMVINLGEYSVDNLLNDRNLEDCLLDSSFANWIEINEAEKLIQILLK